MEITIKTEPKEIADLVLEIQNRHSESFKMKVDVNPEAVYEAIHSLFPNVPPMELFEHKKTR